MMCAQECQGFLVPPMARQAAMAHGPGLPWAWAAGALPPWAGASCTATLWVDRDLPYAE